MKVLAKKPKNPDNPVYEETLEGHTNMVIRAFHALFGNTASEPSYFAKAFLNFFRLQESSEFFWNALVACIFHDIGKANSSFQDSIIGRNTEQVIRHEHLSGMILFVPKIKEFIKNIPNVDLSVVFSAVIGHHLKAEQEHFSVPQNPYQRFFHVYKDYINEILIKIFEDRKILKDKKDKIEDNFSYEIPEIWDYDANEGFSPFVLRENIIREMNSFRRKTRNNDSLKSLLAAVRTALIISDSVGSGLFRVGEDLENWIKEAFSSEISSDYIEEKIIQKRIQEIKTKRGSFSWVDFQNKVENLPSRALLIAPCGSGKTLAAWRWVKAQLQKKTARRVIFLYPTRATATEGFRDYVSWAPEADAGLVHGTSRYELEGMFNDVEDERKGKQFLVDDRMFALGYWHRRIFSATVDQFLGFMQQSYRSICLIPLLAESILVFDEVHSFDKSLFSAFKSFLKKFNVPVLAMTASLPENRKSDLVSECEMAVFPDNTESFADLEQKANLPRYHVNILEDQNEAVRIVEEVINSNKNQKILWVVNTVSRCQQLMNRFNPLSKMNEIFLCYHSRFILEHRKEKHNNLISAFKEDRKFIAFTTQVCEMSLDIDADILISEISPITSLIQRMGRCNRQANLKDNRIGKVFLYKPEDEKPYTKEDFQGVDNFLNEISDKIVSQKTLGDLLVKYGPKEVEIEKYAAFLECGPWAVEREESLREDQDFTVQAILDNQVERYLELRKNKRPTDGMILPAPRKLAKTDHRLGSFPKVAPSANYDINLGLLDSPIGEII